MKNSQAQLDNLKLSAPYRFTSETAREAGRKGNPKSQEARRRNKTMAQLAKQIAEFRVSSADVIARLVELGISEDEANNAAQIVMGVFDHAIRGDIPAVEKWEAFIARAEVEENGILDTDTRRALAVMRANYLPNISSNFGAISVAALKHRYTHYGSRSMQHYEVVSKVSSRYYQYPSTSHAWPYSDINTVREIASFLGVAVDAQTTSLMTGAYMIPLPAQYTIRETLRYIAALYGGSFVVTDANTLRLIPLWSVKSTEDAPLGGTHRLTAATAFPACTGVRFLVDNDQELFAGDETGYVYEISCPFATQAAANALLTKLRGFVYRPFSAEAAVVNPACELGDTLSVPDGLGGTFLTGLFSSDLIFDSLCAASVSAPEDEELDHEYPYIPASERSFTRKIQNVQSELTLQAQQIAAKVSRTGGDASSFGWYLDADKFQLISNGAVVMLVNRNGLSLVGDLTANSGTFNGTVNANAGSIGGCTIENGVLKVANANIDNLNASKITAGTLDNARIRDYSLGPNKIDDYAITNRTIDSQAVSYGKTSFQGTLDQVGTNKANIDTLYGYFEGSASFSSVLTGSLAINYHYLGLETITIGGVNRKVVTWT